MEEQLEYTKRITVSVEQGKKSLEQAQLQREGEQSDGAMCKTQKLYILEECLTLLMA